MLLTVKGIVFKLKTMKILFKTISVLCLGYALYYGSFYLRYDRQFEEISVQQVRLIPNLTEEEKQYFLTSIERGCRWEDYGVQENYKVGNYYNKDGKSLMIDNLRFDLTTEESNECIIVEYPRQNFHTRRDFWLGDALKAVSLPLHSRIMIVALPNLEVKFDILVKGKIRKAMIKNNTLYVRRGQTYLKRKLDL
jgi:hypothetical protein